MKLRTLLRQSRNILKSSLKHSWDFLETTSKHFWNIIDLITCWFLLFENIIYPGIVTLNVFDCEIFAQYFSLISKWLKICTDLRKMVFGSSSTFSSVVRVSQKQWEFIEIWAVLGLLSIVICIKFDLSFLISLIKVTPLMLYHWSCLF